MLERERRRVDDGNELMMGNENEEDRESVKRREREREKRRIRMKNEVV